jgi:hypothetical protein
MVFHKTFNPLPSDNPNISANMAIFTENHEIKGSTVIHKIVILYFMGHCISFYFSILSEDGHMAERVVG